MLNETLVTAVNSLSPIWSQQLITLMNLDQRYQMIIGMLINSLASYIRLTDGWAFFWLGLVICSLLASQINYAWLLSLIFKIKLPNNEVCYIFDKTNTTVPYVENNYALYQVRDQIKPPLSWRIDSANVSQSNTSMSPEHYKYRLTGHVCPQETNGKHQLETSQCSAQIWVTSSDDCYQVHLEFSRGDLETLVIEGFERLPTYINRYHINDSLSRGATMLIEPYGPKYQDQVWRHYYHPQLNYLRRWLKRVDKGQAKQLSIMCTGPPGTGKSELIKRMAAYTQRHIVSVNLATISTIEQAVQIFTRPCVNCCYLHPSQVIYELDELDKSVVTIAMRSKQRNTVVDHLIKQKGDLNKVCQELEPGEEYVSRAIVSNALNEGKLELNEFLKILDGVSNPKGRIIVACSNDIDQIKEMSPQLLRPGRMTIFPYTYGDREMLHRIVEDHGFSFKPLEVSEDYQFSQAHILEWLRVNQEEKPLITQAELDMWRDSTAM